jgi:hypothetical protein
MDFDTARDEGLVATGYLLLCCWIGRRSSTGSAGTDVLQDEIVNADATEFVLLICLLYRGNSWNHELELFRERVPKIESSWSMFILSLYLAG